MSLHLKFQSPIAMPEKSKWGGGPGEGGHQGGWTDRWGNDFGCKVGDQVVAAFDGQILGEGWFPVLENKVSEDGKKYGVQMIVANTGEDPDRVRAYYTHFGRGDPKKIKPPNTLSRGEPIGTIRDAPGIGVHLHFAMIERIGPDWSKSKGVNIPTTLEKWARESPGELHTLQFHGDGSPVTPDPKPPPQRIRPISEFLEEPGDQYRSLDPYAGNELAEASPSANPAYGCPTGTPGDTAVAAIEEETESDNRVALARMALSRTPANLIQLQRAIGNRGTVAALRSSPGRLAAVPLGLPAVAVPLPEEAHMRHAERSLEQCDSRH